MNPYDDLFDASKMVSLTGLICSPMNEHPLYSGRQDEGRFYGSFDHKRTRNNARPQSWFGAPVAERNFRERPRSIHEISLDRGGEGRAFPSGNNDPSKKSHHQPRYRKRTKRQERLPAGAIKGRQGDVELSRSLSSSFSSQVGSSGDDREANHGVYSAYDMTGRSPYGSLVHRRCSQSSLSSSSASWQQSSTSLSHQAGRAPWGSGSLGSSSPDKPAGQQEIVQKAVFIKRPPRIPEVVSTANATFMPTQHSSSHRVRVNAVPHSSRTLRVRAQATPYSSGHHVTKSAPSRSYAGHDAMDSSDMPIIQNLLQVSSASLQSSRSHTIREDEQNVCPSVKDLAKRFSGNSEFFSEAFDGFYENDYRDARRVKAQTWPKFACVHSAKDWRGEAMDDEVFDVAPPKPPYPQISGEDFTVAQTGVQSSLKRSEPEAVSRTSERNYLPLSADGQVRADQGNHSNELAAHRLSLQELIRLHEDQIAKHAKSARATAHAQIYLKRPELNDQSAQRSPSEFKKQEKWYYAKEGPGSGGTPQGSSNQFGTVNRGAESRAQLVAHYQLTELKSDKGAPIKLIEVTGKDASENPRECPSVKAKRHRTIGVVGLRQQIDRVSEGQTDNKPKRHTAIGIVSVKAVATTSRQLAKEEPVVVGHAGYTVHAATEKSTDSLDSSHKEHHSASQEMQLQEKDHRNVKRTCNEYDFQADSLATTNFQDSLVREEVFVRAEASAQFVRPDDVAQVPSRFEHDQEVESTRPAEEAKKTEVEARVVVASPEKSTTSFEAVDNSNTSSLHGYRGDCRTWNVPMSSRTYSYAKPYTSVSKAVPVAQVSPVSPTSEQTLRASLTKESLTDSSPYSRSQSAREMYETRLALWNLYPPEQQIRSAATSSGAHRQQTAGTERSRSTSVNASVLSDRANYVYEAKTKDEPRTPSPIGLEEHYLSRIEKLKDSNKELIAKYEAEKRELRQKYEEQRKVANAYQKLEDRYRRRVHELQEALAGCTCQRSFVRQNKVTQSLSGR